MSEQIPSAPDARNLAQRINAVRKAVRYIQKDKAISGGGANYKAVSHDNVVAVIGDQVIEHGILIYPNQLAGVLGEQGKKADGTTSTMRLYEGDYEIIFENVDEPTDRRVVRIHGHAQDNGDKAPGKAVTYATKSAMLKMFFLETGENEESRMEKNRPITSEQAKLLKKALGDDITKIDTFCQYYEIEDIGELPKGNFDAAMAKIKGSLERSKAGERGR